MLGVRQGVAILRCLRMVCAEAYQKFELSFLLAKDCRDFGVSLVSLLGLFKKVTM